MCRQCRAGRFRARACDQGRTVDREGLFSATRQRYEVSGTNNAGTGAAFQKSSSDRSVSDAVDGRQHIGRGGGHYALGVSRQGDSNVVAGKCRFQGRRGCTGISVPDAEIVSGGSRLIGGINDAGIGGGVADSHFGRCCPFRVRRGTNDADNAGADCLDGARTGINLQYLCPV